MDMAHPGEAELRGNLKQAQASAARRARRQALFLKLRAWFGAAADKETPVPDALAHLKRQLAEARHERDTALDELALLKGRLSSGKEQVHQILESFKPADVGQAVSKAKAYDELSPHLSTLALWAEALGAVSDRLGLRRVVRAMHGELSTARDGFQKIKIYRKFLGRLGAFPQLGPVLKPFLEDRNLIKDRKKVEFLVEELRRATDVEQDIEPLLKNGDELEQLREALAPFATQGYSGANPSPRAASGGPEEAPQKTSTVPENNKGS